MKVKKDFLHIRYNSGDPLPFFKTRLESQQLFVSRLVSPDNKQSRLFVAHIPGSGKTITALQSAMNYLKLFKLFTEQSYNIIILGFQKTTFLEEIMNQPDLGYISELEHNILLDLKENIHSQFDQERYIKYKNYLKNKISNLAFYGYQELYNMLFVGEEKTVNEDTLKIFEKCFIICDEIHNVYNSVETNNYGEAIKTILNWHLDLKLENKFLKIIFMSATPINNNPTEIVDILNLVIPRANYKISDFFSKKDNKNLLLPGALQKIKKITEGYFSFYANNDPRLFPDWVFDGEKVSDINFLKFILCPISKDHLEIYKNLESIPLDSFGVLDGVFPITEDTFGYKTVEIDKIKNQEEKWKNKKGIITMEGTIGGTILKKDNIKNYSGKYYQMISDLLENLKKDGGKIIIEHEYVNGTGIKMIEQVLLANGFIPENGLPSDNTLCSICGLENLNHKNHEFMPAKYVLAIGEIDKKILKTSIAKFNSLENLLGHKIKVLLGSELIREGLNFLAVENFWIMHYPSSVSTLIQLIGRPIRKNSHIALPEHRRKVHFRLYIYDIPSKYTNFEKIKYRIKMQNYAIIREIERVIHESAIDNHIYYDLIKKSFVKPSEIGILPFKKNNVKGDIGIKILPYDKSSYEIEEIRSLIISYFYKSPIWSYDQLWKEIRNPIFTHFVDASLFSEDNFILALGDLIYGDWRIFIKGEANTIVESSDFLILYPIVSRCDETILGCEKKIYNGVPVITPTSWIDLPDKGEIFSLNITNQLISLNTNYEEMKRKFYEKYRTSDILTIPTSTETYGITFHEKLIEECISYIFNILTGKIDRSEYHELYFKMVNFYSKIDLIIYANNLSEELFNFYKDYTTKETDTNTLLMPKTQTSTLSSFEMSEIEKFLKKKEKKVPSNILPVGHFLTKTKDQRFYLPQGWFNGTVFKQAAEIVENDIIVGYYDRSEETIEFKFKLRSPIHKMKKETDIRLQEKGVVCETRKKEFLKEIAEKLSLTPFGTNQEMCNLIKTDLLHRELKDRNKYRKGLISTRTRWCYLQTENLPNIN